MSETKMYTIEPIEGEPEREAEPSCKACGQIDHGQTGEYPCAECELPTLHDEPNRPDAERALTPRQRAGAVWDMFTMDLMMPNGDRPPVTVGRVILAIEQAVIAAVEAEREACAETAKEIHDQRGHFDAAGAACAHLIEQRIRARKETK
jgi:hypothetical protein